MNSKLTAMALVALIASSAPAFAQAPLTGGPTAKGNAPVKPVHTVNDGAAKPGANSFTEKQARQHILNAGYQSVSGLTKGKDGIWRGTATKGTATMPVAMDFKGNVTDGEPVLVSGGSATAASSGQGPALTATATAGGSSTRRTHRRKHHHVGCSTHPGPNGVACSGVDTNRNGVSDKEDRALRK